MIAIDLGIQEVLLFLKGKYFEGKKVEEKLDLDKNIKSINK